MAETSNTVISNDALANPFESVSEDAVYSEEFAHTVFKLVNKLCDIEDPDETPYKSKYRANDILVLLAPHTTRTLPQHTHARHAHFHSTHVHDNTLVHTYTRTHVHTHAWVFPVPSRLQKQLRDKLTAKIETLSKDNNNGDKALVDVLKDRIAIVDCKMGSIHIGE